MNSEEKSKLQSIPINKNNLAKIFSDIGFENMKKTPNYWIFDSIVQEVWIKRKSGTYNLEKVIFKYPVKVKESNLITAYDLIEELEGAAKEYEGGFLYQYALSLFSKNDELYEKFQEDLSKAKENTNNQKD